MGAGRRGRRTNRALLYSIPVIALLILVAMYYMLFIPVPPVKPAMDFSLSISIVVIYNSTSSSTGQLKQYIVPPPIGVQVQGGVWNSHLYDKNGIDGRYPVYTLGPGSNATYAGYSVIYVRSRVVRAYTLGDFFTVWGEPLGLNNTLGLTSPPPPGSRFGPGWFWDLCIGLPPFVTRIPPQSWSNLTLTQELDIGLSYSNTGCTY